MNLIQLVTLGAPHPAPQTEIRDFCRTLFEGVDFDLDSALRVFESAGIERRTLALPLERYGRGFRPSEHHGEFRRVGTELLAAAVERAVPRELAAQVTHVVTVTSSGVATPTLECALFEGAGISPRARRVPLFGLGCAGGVAGLQLARDLAASRPDALVLVLCVELTSLTLLAGDRSQRNLVACALFGDGAAAALVASPGLTLPSSADHRVLARLGPGTTRLLPASEGLMGWDVEDAGWRVIFSPRIPGVVRREVAALVDGVTDRGALRHFVLHPGGRKVLEAYEEALDLKQDELSGAREALRANGNMSAASVFFVLERILRDPGFAPGPGIATAFGPGFTAEGLSLELENGISE